MPFKTEYLTSLYDPSGLMDYMSFNDANDANDDMFDQTFSANLDMVEWQDWMESGESVEVGAVVPLQRQQNCSSTSTLESWPINMETVRTEETLVAPMNANKFTFRGGEFATGSNRDTLLTSRISTPQVIQQSTQNFPALTKAQILALEAIAMPGHTFLEVNIGDPSTPLALDSSSPSPEPEIRIPKTQKRKSITVADESTEVCQSRKRGHNTIEKRYRANLNDKIKCLRDGVPALWPPGSEFGHNLHEDSDDDVDRKGTQQKYGKAAILTRALEYIQHLECTAKRLGGDVDSLKLRIGAFEKLGMSRNQLASSGTLVIANEVPVKRETLESIQSEFQQIRPRQKSIVVATLVTRKRSAKQGKKL